MYTIHSLGEKGPRSFANMSFDYDYPQKMDLKPGSELHERLKVEILRRARESYDVMKRRHPDFRSIDRTLTAYIPTDDAEKEVQSKDSRKPVSIVVPHSYAILETLLTYWTSIFLELPYFRYMPTAGDPVGTILLEKVIEQQCIRNKVGLSLYTLGRDSFAYGFGVVSPIWTTKEGFKRTRDAAGVSTAKRSILFEGNKVENIDPYHYLPDPSVPIHDPQKGEFCGWIEETNFMSLLNDESKTGSSLFNVQYIRGIDGRSSLLSENGENDREYKYGGRGRSTGASSQDATNPVDVIWMYVLLVPQDEEWKLPGPLYPEKWLFGLAGDEVIICAMPLGLDHDEYPIDISAPDFDGYSICPIGKLEVNFGLQKFLDFLINCYDDQTEVLTSRGWIKFPETKEDDEVATVDPVTNQLWFEKPKQWFVKDYNGWMINLKSSRMDVCVTPNHNLFGRYRHSSDWDFVPAALVHARSDWDELKTLGNVRWEGVISEDDFEIIQEGYETVSINPTLMAGFLGWFLSEGSITHGGLSGSYIVAIKQKKSENFFDIDSIMKSMPFHVTRSVDDFGPVQWAITHKGLYMWLKENCYDGGTTGEFKKIPDFVRSWDELRLSLIFSRAMKGDGYWYPEPHSNLGQYSSKSKTLVDGLHEVAVKLGYFSYTSLSSTPKGEPFFRLTVNSKQTFPTISKRNVFKSEYHGKVYCFENSTHITVTRRNGKVAIHGQSHMTNVRKAINDMLIVDPYLININDLKDPNPGKLVRTRRAAWGKGVENAVKQLQIVDITKNHMVDASMVMDIMNRSSSASDAVQGIIRKGSERRSATEYRDTKMGAISRMARAAKIASLMCFYSLGYHIASHTLQFMTQDVYLNTYGRFQNQLEQEYGYGFGAEKGELVASPNNLSIDYGVLIHDGTSEFGEYPETWTQLYQILASNPAIGSGFDMTRIFMHIARMMGAKNVNDFVRKGGQLKIQTMQDQQVLDQMKAGDLMPLLEGQGA